MSEVFWTCCALAVGFASIPLSGILYARGVTRALAQSQEDVRQHFSLINLMANKLLALIDSKAFTLYKQLNPKTDQQPPITNHVDHHEVPPSPTNGHMSTLAAELALKKMAALEERQRITGTKAEIPADYGKDQPEP